MPDRDWMNKAACRGYPPDDWFPLPADKRGQQRASSICHTCPVRPECATYAAETKAAHGVWAGRYRNEKAARSGIYGKRDKGKR